MNRYYFSFLSVMSMLFLFFLSHVIVRSFFDLNPKKGQVRTDADFTTFLLIEH
jgi:hypothetical protein